MNELQKELRLGNCLEKYGKVVIVDIGIIQKIINGSVIYKSIPLTKENIEKYIDWSFEFGFNKSIFEKEYWIEYQFLMENAIDGCTDFEIIVSESKSDKIDSQINYYIDDKLLEFGLDDTLHNLQNLFYICSGQELPIKNYG